MAFDRSGFDREVGLLLQLARKRREVTQAQLAKEIGIPRASYANFESGRQRIPVDILWRAAVVLNVPISSLVPEPVNRPSSKPPVFQLPEDIFGKSAKPWPTVGDSLPSFYGMPTTNLSNFIDPLPGTWPDFNYHISKSVLGEDDG